MSKARRHLMRALRPILRRAALMVCFVATGAAAQAAQSVCTQGDGAHIRKVCLETVQGAAVYGHGVLGRTPEWNALTVFWGPKGQALSDAGKATSTVSQPRHIFEDVAPRITDLDGDGLPEIIVVQSGFNHGARLMVLRSEGALSAVTTPYIGTRNRWLAPVGAADLDGDGHVEIAYVDRPHLAKTLRVVRFKDGMLTPVASLTGLSNHKIGEADIGGGIRTCDGSPQMILARGDWQRIMAVRLEDGTLVARDIGRHKGRTSLNRAVTCD